MEGEDYDFLIPEEHAWFHEAECYTPSTVETLQSKPIKGWRKTPRTPADFYESSSSSNESFSKSEYDSFMRFISDSIEDEEDNAVEVKSVATNTTDNNINYDTKYWGVHDVRRHWPLPKTPKEILYFPSIYPTLDVRSRYGRYVFQLFNAAAMPNILYKKKIQWIFGKNLQHMNRSGVQIKNLVLSDTLARLPWFDSLSRVMIIRILCQFFRKQLNLENVSFENAQLEKHEGVILLCALNKNCGGTIKELNIWKLFAFGHNPVLKDKFSLNVSSKLSTEIHFLEILNKFDALTYLSINYGYLANEDGNVLLCLRSVKNCNLKELRILCTPEERPFKTCPGFGVGGHIIRDGVWRRVAHTCPNLKVSFVFVNLPQYENIILFLTKSIPVNYVYISSGIDFTFESPWDIDSTLLELRNWYASTLEVLCLHLWHHRDLLDFVIEKKILIEFPYLKTFEFIGILEDIKTLEVFCSDLASGKFQLKKLLFWVEEVYSHKKKRTENIKIIQDMRKNYKIKFQALNIDADIQTYAI